MLTEFLLIVVIGAGVLYWQAGVRCKELATQAARRECKLCDVQLLDQTVVQLHISLSRDETGQWRVWRDYRFEYSHNGDDRHTGRLTMLGHRVIRVALETFNPVIH